MSPLNAAKGRGLPAQSIRVYSEYPISFGFNGKTSGSGNYQVGHSRSHFFTAQLAHKSFAENLAFTEIHNCIKFAIQNWSYLLGEVEHRSHDRYIFYCYPMPASSFVVLKQISVVPFMGKSCATAKRNVTWQDLPFRLGIDLENLAHTTTRSTHVTW